MLITLEIAAAVCTISAWVVAVYFQWTGTAVAQRLVLTITGFAFLLFAVLAHRRRVRAHPQVGPSPGEAPRAQAPRVESLSGKLQIAIDMNREYEVFYSLPFRRPPELNIRVISGGIDFDIVEQRRDGFRIKTRGSSAFGSSAGITLQWDARGEIPPSTGQGG
jgi:hypothetical protein